MLFNEMNPLIMHLDVKAMPNCHKNLYSLTQFLYMFYCEPVIVSWKNSIGPSATLLHRYSVPLLYQSNEVIFRDELKHKMGGWTLKNRFYYLTDEYRMKGKVQKNCCWVLWNFPIQYFYQLLRWRNEIILIGL